MDERTSHERNSGAKKQADKLKFLFKYFMFSQSLVYFNSLYYFISLDAWAQKIHRLKSISKPPLNFYNKLIKTKMWLRLHSVQGKLTMRKLSCYIARVAKELEHAGIRFGSKQKEIVHRHS